MGFLIIYFVVQISFFATLLRHFIQSNFNFFCRRPIMVDNVFTQSPTTKMLPKSLNIMIQLISKIEDGVKIMRKKTLEFLAKLH